MAPRQIYASSLTRRQSSWSRQGRRRRIALYPVWVISFSALLTQVLRAFG